MTTRLRVLACTALCAVLAVPAFAQQNSDTGGALPQSDVSGTLTQSDVMAFQSDEARLRMEDMAASLVSTLRSGQITERGGQPISVPGPLAAYLTAAPTKATAQPIADRLVAAGLARSSAQALAEAGAGLLHEQEVAPEQVAAALQAYNAAVEAAPTLILARPPAEMLVLRAVLVSLLEGAAE